MVSEFMRAKPNEAVIRWRNRQAANSVYTTAITLYEIEFGLQRLPRGKRRSTLADLFRGIVAKKLGGRVLSCDAKSALAAGGIGAALQAEGRTVDVRDPLIAGVVRTRRATLAMRNVSNFEHACAVINPWEDA